MDKEQVIEKVKGIIPILSNHLKLDYVVLFGSQINGTPYEYSDIDLAIVASDLPKGILDDNVLEALVKIHNIDWRFEPHFFRIEKWNSAEEGSFINHIKKTGKVIFSNGSK